MSGPWYSYILASKYHGALYVGLTTDLIGEINAHRRNRIGGLTSLYPIHRLVYFERHADPKIAHDRAGVLKRWHRKWKLELIDAHNPDWDDLYPLIADCSIESGAETQDLPDEALC